MDSKEYTEWQRKTHYEMLRLYLEFTQSIESFLETCIEIYFLNKGTEDDLLNELNEQLQFHQKLWLCEMIISSDHKKLYTKKEFKELRRIIKLRNKFAHSILVVDDSPDKQNTEYISLRYRYKSRDKTEKIYLKQYELDHKYVVRLSQSVINVTAALIKKYKKGKKIKKN